MRPILFSLAISLQEAALPLIPAPPPDPAIGHWAMWPGTDFCTAKTVFAGGATLRVRYDVGRDRTLFTVWDPSWRFVEGGQRYAVTLRTGQVMTHVAEISLGLRYSIGDDDHQGLVILGPNDEDAFLTALGTSRAIEVSVGERRVGTYELPNTPDVMAALVRCAEAGPIRAASPSAPGSMGSHFRTEDYPTSALRYEQQGTVLFRVTIAPDGTVRDCIVTASSGVPRLDEETCRIAKERARFHPPRDAAGNPASVVDEHSVTWSLPRE